MLSACLKGMNPALDDEVEDLGLSRYTMRPGDDWEVSLCLTERFSEKRGIISVLGGEACAKLFASSHLRIGKCKIRRPFMLTILRVAARPVAWERG